MQTGDIMVQIDITEAFCKAHNRWKHLLLKAQHLEE